jgi:hypothetical protein
MAAARPGVGGRDMPGHDEAAIPGLARAEGRKLAPNHLKNIAPGSSLPVSASRFMLDA